MRFFSHPFGRRSFSDAGDAVSVAVPFAAIVLERRELGIATATTSFFRALGGAVFAARAGIHASPGLQLTAAGRADIIGAVQLVFLSAAPLAALALLVALRLPELTLQTRVGARTRPHADPGTPQAEPDHTAGSATAPRAGAAA